MGFVRIFVLACVMLVLSGSMAMAKDKQFVLNFYGHDYTVTPRQVEGTTITFGKAKSYIPIVFPDYKSDTQDRGETIAFVMALINGYDDLYESAIHILATRLVREGKVAEKETDESFETFKKDLKKYFRHGKMKQAIARYAPGSKAFAYHFAQVQEMYLRHLTCVYIYNMIRNSPEGQAALKELNKELGE